MRHIIAALVLFTCGLGIVSAQSAEPPEAGINPQSLEIEIADPVWAGTNFDIRYVINPGKDSTTFDLATNPADDLHPRLAIDPDGDAWVVWWRDGATSQVLARRHDHATDTWSAEVALGDPGTPGRNPDVAFDGSRTWVAFEALAPPGTGIMLGALDDSPDPVSVSTSVGTTTYQGQLDLQLHAKSGRLWVTWTDSLSEIGWSGYDETTDYWSLPGYESYAGQGSKDALSRIEGVVLGE